jgi:hypothetical protein
MVIPFLVPTESRMVRRYGATHTPITGGGERIRRPRLRTHLSPWGEPMELGAHRQSGPSKKRAGINWMISASVTRPNDLAART